MDVLILLVFVSLVLVAGAVLLFLVGIRGGDFEHAERLSLLPLEPDEGASTRTAGETVNAAPEPRGASPAGSAGVEAAPPEAAGSAGGLTLQSGDFTL